jgi:hypothetical protein
VVIWAGVALFLSNIVWNRFKQLTGRDDIIRPEGMPRSLALSRQRLEGHAGGADHDDHHQP